MPSKAPLCITADQLYMLYVNGVYAGRGPARGYQESWPFDEIDIATHLRAGRNWISVVAYNGGVSTYQYIHRGVAGLLCAARWDGLELLSDRSWLGRTDQSHRPQTERMSTQINFQEQVDGRLDDGAWITSARPPRGWPALGTVRAFGSMPWHTVEPRGIPNLSNEVMAYQRTVAMADGRCAEGFADCPNVTRLFRQENRKANWRPANVGRASPDGMTLTLPAAGPGRFTAVSMDLGTLAIGTLVVEASGAAGGEIMDFYFCEVMDGKLSPAVPEEGYACSASMSARLVLRPGRTRHEFFQVVGHRFLVAIARDTRRPIRLKLVLRHCAYPMEIAGHLACGDDTLNAIHAISVRTQQVCALDAYVDTPWREQAQWWGDARVQGQNTFHLCGDERLLARGIRSIARQDVPNGLTYGHAPTCAHHCILPDFSIIWTLTVWDHYWQTGDTTLAREQWPRIERVLGYFESDAPRLKGLLAHDRRYWLFLDWADVHKDGAPAMLNLWYLVMLEKLAVLARAGGIGRWAAELSALHTRTARRVVSLLWDGRAGMFRDGLAPDGRPARTCSIHTQTLAIMAGLKSGSHGNMIRRRLMPYLEGKDVPGPLPSSYWVTYVYDVMEAAGHGREVAAHIRRLWSPMVPYGGTWEVFDQAAVGIHNSTSHAWAAHPIYHLARTLGGIVQTDVAWRRVRFAPVLPLHGEAQPLTDRAETAVPTPHGLIHSSWRRKGDVIEVELRLPRGVNADVQLPGAVQKGTTGHNSWMIRN
ncbi:MAG: alpha-L-rhamnosidase C-terminal domain-containing protein [Phycisphaerae bacterium]